MLNVAEDHLDWHGSMDAYAADKARALDGRVAVVGLDDPVAAGLLNQAAASVRVGFRLGDPAAGELGVRDGALFDRAFAAGLVLADTASIPVPGPVGVLNALAAAALARAVDVPAEAIADALRRFTWARTGPRWSPVRWRFLVFYMGRQVWMVFFGEARSEAAAHAEESPHIMTVPLIILAALSLLGGRTR